METVAFWHKTLVAQNQEHLSTWTPTQAPQEPFSRLTTSPRRVHRPLTHFLIGTTNRRRRTPEKAKDREGFYKTTSWSPVNVSVSPPKQSLLHKLLVDFCPESSSLNSFNVVVINGQLTRKRRAEDSEIELVASINGITDTTSPIITSREGKTTSESDLGHQAKVSWFHSVRLAQLS